MRAIHLFIIYVFCLGVSVAHEAQTSDRESIPETPVTNKSQPPRLQLRTTIIDHKYCKADEELDVLQMDLRLKFTNTSNQDIVLYRYSDRVSRVMVGQSQEDVAANRFEINASFTLVTAPAKEHFTTQAFNKLFVVLRPGTSYETKTRVGVFLVRGKEKSITGTVGAGEHVLLIEVPTWPGLDGGAKELPKAWRRRGVLFSEPIISEPMSFKVERDRKIVSCSE